MKGVDYTKALARERDNFQNTIQKDRAYTAKTIKDEQELHAAAQKKQRDVYERDRSRLEEGHQASLEKITNDSLERNEVQKNNFNDRMTSEQERFTRDRNKLAKDFDTRFRNIQESYQRHDASQKNQHDNMQANQKQRYERNVKDIVDEKDRSVKKFQDRMIGAGANLRAESAREKQLMAREHESAMENLYKDEADKRFQLKERLQGDLSRVRESSKQELEQLDEYNRQKNRNLTQNYEASTSMISDDYSRKSEEMSRKEAAEDHQRTKEHQNDMREIRRQHDKDLRFAALKSREVHGTGEFADVAKRQQGKDENAVLTDRLKRLNHDMRERDRANTNRRAEDADRTSEMFAKESRASSERYEEQRRDLTADKIVSMSKEREKSTKLHAQQETTLHNERTRYEGQLLTERNDANKKLHELKENFNESMKKLEQNNQKQISASKTASDDEKRAFIEQTHKNRAEEITDLRRNFNVLMDNTVSTYEDRLHRSVEENKRLKEALDQKVGFERDHAENRIQEQTDLYNNKRAADAKSSQEDNDKREADFRKQMRELTTSYQRKMDLQQYNSEIKLKHTSRDYQNQLKNQAQNYEKKLAEQKSMSEMEIKRLTHLRETEKAQISQQYENELTQSKQAHQEAIDRLDEYKRMG